MSETEISSTGHVRYELEIEIGAAVETVWAALLEETNAWWLADFHMVDPESTVEFDVSPGGRGLIEYREGGGFLVWYTVQFFLPDQFKIYLIGNVAPDWGGPSTSNLCLAVEPSARGSVLRVRDAHHGKIDAAYVASLKEGWTQLFQSGLRDYVEASRSNERS